MKAVFDKNSPMWTTSFESNLAYLRYMQNFLNDLLKARGYVTIVEVYNYLGLEHNFSGVNAENFKNLCWLHEDGDKIDFGGYGREDENIIYLDFNIDID